MSAQAGRPLTDCCWCPSWPRATGMSSSFVRAEELGGGHRDHLLQNRRLEISELLSSTTWLSHIPLALMVPLQTNLISTLNCSPRADVTLGNWPDESRRGGTEIVTATWPVPSAQTLRRLQTHLRWLSAFGPHSRSRVQTAPC